MRETGTQPDYEKLYHMMVDASERTLDALEAARQLLIRAEQGAEEAYMGQ